MYLARPLLTGAGDLYLTSLTWPDCVLMQWVAEVAPKLFLGV